MALKNHCLSQLTSTSTYNEVFDREILGRMHAFRNANPQQKIYMMAWGDTARPLLSAQMRLLNRWRVYILMSSFPGMLKPLFVVFLNCLQHNLSGLATASFELLKGSIT